MLLFQKRFHAGLVDGSITRTFRLWEKPKVKVGGRYRVHPIGVVEVDAVVQVTLASLSDAAARAGGFSSRGELLEYLAPVAKAPLTDATVLFDVTLRHGGDGDRVPLALEDALTDDDVQAISRALERLDRPGRWTKKVLALITKRPRVAASKLAKSLRLETLPFKADVVKLKKLGLTQSFEVGYEISPRGRAYLGRVSRRATGSPRAPGRTSRGAVRPQRLQGAKAPRRGSRRPSR